MKQQWRAIRAGVVLVLLAAVWRLASGSAFFGQPDVAAFLVYLGTGRPVHPQAQTEPQSQQKPNKLPLFPEITQTLPTQEPPALKFYAEDSDYLSVYDLCGYGGGGSALLQMPLDWDLTEDGPTVLILHTHATESYTKGGREYTESSAYRTRDPEYNVVRVGQQLAQRLEDMGISVIHDTTLHDYPSYTGSYNNSRRAVQEYLAKYPSVQLVLDIHRDAALNPNGTQMTTEAFVDGKDSAQLMLVVGSNVSGLEHPEWERNLALAAKLQVTLEKRWEGLMRPVCLRRERFNQDLLPGMLLVEVGTAGNDLQEALVATDCLAWAIAQLAHGTAAG